MARWLCGVSELEALAVVVSVFLVCAHYLHIHGELYFTLLYFEGPYVLKDINQATGTDRCP